MWGATEFPSSWRDSIGNYLRSLSMRVWTMPFNYIKCPKRRKGVTVVMIYYHLPGMYIDTTYFLMKEASVGKLSVPRSSLAVIKRVPDSIRLDGKAHHIVNQNKSTQCGLCHKNIFMKCSKCNVALHEKCTVDFHSKQFS